MDRYARQVALPAFGPGGQEALRRAHVLVVGAGGLGSPALLYLAGAGVGRISLIDADLTHPTNLHRQVIHTSDSVGELKVDSAARAIRALNPEVEVVTYAERFTVDNALRLLTGSGNAGDPPDGSDPHTSAPHFDGGYAGAWPDAVDLVIDGSDNFATRHVISWACAQAAHPAKAAFSPDRSIDRAAASVDRPAEAAATTGVGIPHVWGSILGMDAQVSVFWAGRGPIYEDLYPVAPPPGTVPSCAQAGVLGTVVGIAGTTMAHEAVKILSGVGTPLLGKVGYYSGLDGQWEYIPLQADPAALEAVRDPARPYALTGPTLVSPAALLVSAESLEHAQDPTCPRSPASPGEPEIARRIVLHGEERDVVLVDVREPSETGVVPSGAAPAIATAEAMRMTKRQVGTEGAPGLGSTPESTPEAKPLAGAGAPLANLPLEGKPLAGARLIPLGEIAGHEAELRELAESNHVIVYCASGVRSGEAARWLGERGVRVASLGGGLAAWHEYLS